MYLVPHNEVTGSDTYTQSPFEQVEYVFLLVLRFGDALISI